MLLADSSFNSSLRVCVCACASRPAWLQQMLQASHSPAALTAQQISPASVSGRAAARARPRLTAAKVRKEGPRGDWDSGSEREGRQRHQDGAEHVRAGRGGTPGVLCHQPGGLGLSPVMREEGRGSFAPLFALTALQKLTGAPGQSPEGLRPQPGAPRLCPPP